MNVYLNELLIVFLLQLINYTKESMNEMNYWFSYKKWIIDFYDILKYWILPHSNKYWVQAPTGDIVVEYHIAIIGIWDEEIHKLKKLKFERELRSATASPHVRLTPSPSMSSSSGPHVILVLKYSYLNLHGSFYSGTNIDNRIHKNTELFINCKQQLTFYFKTLVLCQLYD